ncbi:MAG: AAA family ATPase [Candidatus Eisenbacteria sp.]|nr:AAA family ATPase [Candidatus Eisenbacteria bacterium]
MLRKTEEIQVTPDNPFTEDKLQRRRPVENMAALISTITQPFVLAVDGRWGTGKTVFAHMLRAQLQSRGHPCIYFNAWENDFVADPMVAFLGEIDAAIKSKALKLPPKAAARKKWRSARQKGEVVLRAAAPLAVRILSQGIIDAPRISEALEKLAGEALDGYPSQKKQMESFRESLQGFVDAVGESAENQRLPVVLIIDELDRCRPTFALELLEQVKHLFSVRGMVFVLAIDLQQLSSMAKAVYGPEMDGRGYLRRFIDLTYELPQPDLAAYCQHVIDDLELPTFFSPRQNGVEDAEHLLSTVTGMAEVFQLSLRALEQCLTEINIVLRTTPPSHLSLVLLTSFLITLRAWNADLYHQFAEGKIGAGQLLSGIPALANSPYFQGRDHDTYMTACLYAFSGMQGEAEARIEERKATMDDSDRTDHERRLAQSELESLVPLTKHHMTTGLRLRALRTVLSRIQAATEYVVSVPEE